MVVNVLAKTADDLGGALSPERIALSLEMTVLGLLAVFSVLAIIWLVLTTFKFFFYTDPNGATSKKDEKTEDKAQVQQNIENVPPAPIQSSDDATVAAIIAAISAYIADDPELSSEYSGGFRVVSFKRIRPKATWNNKNN